KTYSLYYSVSPQSTVYSILTDDEREELYALAEEKGWGDVEYKGTLFHNGPDDYYTYGKAEYHKFNYSIKDGKIKYISDEWAKTLPAKYSAVPYSITYKLDGGKNNSQNPATYYSGDTVTLKSPTKSGYVFMGWYADAKKVTKIANTSGNKTLTAKWETAHTITYKLNGGTNNSANPKTYASSTGSATLKNPTRKGYTFKGWFSDSRLKNKITKIAKGSAGNKNVYAKWAKTYKITYKLNGGINNAKNPKTYTKIDATITLNNPTRKGYVFKGWYKDAKFKKKITQIKKGSWNNKTLYAKWARK
ncbi:MAG: InlB B-repeat-containing protein, partial [Clostridia bacterium]|nr:InlB B-repeat-containing protein [Clostridia bacterium]